MSRSTRILTAAALLAVIAAPQGCAERDNSLPRGFDQGAVMTTTSKGEASIFGRETSLSAMDDLNSGFLVADDRGGAILIPGAPRGQQNKGFIEARDLKLQIRELCDQLLATVSNEGLLGMVALPSSFVELDDFDKTSSLGRYMAEGMIYEFNKRGFPIREYRMSNVIRVRPEDGEFVLSRNLGNLPGREKWAALVAGTYYADKDAVFINARLIRAADGMVLRTGQLVLRTDGLLNRMLGRRSVDVGPLAAGTMQIRSLNDAGPGYVPSGRK